MPLSKDFRARGRVYADPGFYRYGGVVQGFVRSPFGDPDLRSPSGFDSGLSPSAQDDTEGRDYAVSMRGQPFTMVAPGMVY